MHFLGLPCKTGDEKGKGPCRLAEGVPMENVLMLPRVQLACAVPLADLGLSQGAVGDLVGKQGS